MTEDRPVVIPVDGVLDLHTFRPGDVKNVVLDYLEACREKGVRHLRIIHGKGIGNLRRTVHAILAKHPQVHAFVLGDQESGSWGATLVELKE
jgi:DNA-nicking Smr family endonuclease